MEKYKIIHFNLFKPHKSLFKQCRNDQSEVQIISCCNSQNCRLFDRKECSFRMSFTSNRCPYGKYWIYRGFTRRASKYSSWNQEQEKRYDGIGFLKVPSKMMAIVGEYIFLPYSFMDLCNKLPWNGLFIAQENFTIDTVITLVNFRPYAMFGGEITEYQKEIPPKFLKHLSEQLPILFEQVIAKDKYSAQRFKEFSNVGRKAILETVTPNIGSFVDIHGASWNWNGKELRSINSHASFMLVNKFKELIIIPEKGQEIIIRDDKQVNKNTVFVD